MGRATRTELLWAYAITREEFLKRVNDKFELHPEEWKKYTIIKENVDFSQFNESLIRATT